MPGVSPAEHGVGGASTSQDETIRIARIREEMRMSEEHQFEPSYVPIGPYRKGKQPLLENKIKKEKESMVNPYLAAVLKHNKDDAPRALVEKKLGELQDNAKKCYADDVDTVEEASFRMMMMDDGIYVLNSLVTIQGSPKPACAEIILSRDVVLLLENQIPWLVLNELGNLAGYGDQEHLHKRVREMLADGLYIIGNRTTTKLPSHLLHLVHIYFAPTNPRETRSDIAARSKGPWKHATFYRKYGHVKFQRREFNSGEVESVLDVTLEGRTLMIPCLRIDGKTFTILRNLMALEEQMKEKPVTAYCLFMSQLACQVNDVELLDYAGIIELFLGNYEEVVKGFSNLCKGVIYEINNEKSNLDYIRHDLHERCNNVGINLMGAFVARNFTDHVQVLSFLGALLLLVLQIAQVLFGALSYFSSRPHSDK